MRSSPAKDASATAAGASMAGEAVRSTGNAPDRRFMVLERDLVALRESEARQAFLLELSDALRPLREPAEIEAAAARVLGEHLDANRVLYAEIDGTDAVIERDWTRGAASMTGRFPLEVYGPLIGNALRTGETLVVGDVARDPRLSESARAALLDAEVCAVIATSLVKEGRCVAALAVHSTTPRAWTNAEIALLHETAERTWAAVELAYTELAQRRAEAALRESEAKYRSLFESIDSGFCVIEVIFDEKGEGIDHRFLEVNPAFERQTGIRDAVGRTMRELVPNHEEHWFRIYGEVARTGTPRRFEKPAAKLDRYYEVYAFRIGDPDECRVAILFNDIRDRKRYEERLRESDRRKDDFIAMLGHELRNPLAAIRSAAELLERTDLEDSRLHRAQGVIERQSIHMTRLIDGLLEVGRIARGKIELEPQTIDTRAIVRETVEDRAAEIAKRGLTIECALPDRPVWIRADRVRIVQVLDNLLGNAIKFTPGPGRIDVAVREDGDDAVIVVRDTGVGVRPEMLDRLFEPFQQEPQDIARAEGGLGLGLALVRGLVELHGGNVRAASAGPGRGTELEVRLPRGSSPTATSGREEAPGVTGRRILIVEDNVDAGEMLRELLEAMGHDVNVAETGTRALDLLASRGADIVICDLGLPDMSGYDVVRHIREDPSLRPTPVVALTGYGQPEDRRKTKDAGFDEHLTKPIDLETLTAVIDRLTDR